MPNNKRHERGFVAVTAALVLVVLLLFAGLSIDVGYMMYQKRLAQSAADAAASGGLRELNAGGNAAAIVSAGRDDSSMNGFTNGATSTTVAVNYPPNAGSFSGNNNAVEAVVTRTLPTFFMMLAGTNSATVSARAVALRSASGTGLGGCIFTLNKAASRSFSLAGSNATYLACSSVVESTSGSAFYMEGSGTLYLQNSAKVGVVGGYQLTGGTQLWNVATNSQTFPITISDPGDPLASFVAPTGGTIRGTNVYYDKNAPPPGNTMQPGIYCGGLRVGNTGSVTFNLAPGTYIMAGGGFNLGSQGKVSATGVTIYNSKGSGWGCAGNAGTSPVLIDGQAVLTMTAPTSGALAGIAFFEDRTLSGLNNRIVGGGGTTIDGSLYFKNSPLLFSGNSSSTGYMVIVVNTLTITGNSTVGANYSSLATPNIFVGTPSGGVLSE